MAFGRDGSSFCDAAHRSTRLRLGSLGARRLWVFPDTSLRVGCKYDAHHPIRIRFLVHTRVRKKHYRAIIAGDVRRFGHVINKDGVLGTHNRIFLYQNGRMCPRRKARVRAPCKVTGRLTECPNVSVTALRPWRLAAPPGPWAANRPIAPHYAPSGYIRLDRPNSNCDPTHARGEPHD
jgi:hypothetical protein